MHDTPALVPAAHRAMRRLDPRESAFPGELTTDGERVMVRMDADDVAEPLWRYAAAEHVAGVRDVVRRGDGHDALLPWCTDPIETFLARRTGTERPLTAGEIVTLVCSLLRGVGEIGDADVRGTWWLQDDLRPLYVPGEGVPCLAATVEIVERVRTGCADRALERVLGEICRMPPDARAAARHLDRWERELTELAAPKALERQDDTPARVSTISMHTARLPEVARQVSSRREGAVARILRPLRKGMRALVVTLGERAPRPPLRRVRDAERVSTRPGRGRMLLLGAGVAAVVLLGGLLWPADGENSSAVETSRAAGEEDRPRPSASATAAAPSEPAEGASPSASNAPDAAARVLLDTIGTCAAQADTACADAVVEGAGPSVIERLGGDVRDRDITPIEDYGDIAVVRLGEGHAHGEQMLVMVRQKDGWLVRDVYDVADQPSVRG